VLSTSFESTPRFLRPSDIGRVRRNQRRIQLTRGLMIARNVVFAAAAVAVGLWLYRHTQSDARFAVRHIEIAGFVHTPRPALEAMARTYVGTNLFRIDIARVQQDLGSISWIRRITIEKKLPDTLRINIVERTPVALLQDAGSLRYVDATGVVIADLSPSVGDLDLPVITSAAGPELERAIALLSSLRQSDPVLYSRIAELRPVPPRGFAIFDRDLGALLYANAEDIAPKWRELYTIVRAEQFGRSDIEYADLRFGGRIIVKPLKATTAAAPPLPVTTTMQITN
jgi:cell division protein FtsQ